MRVVECPCDRRKEVTTFRCAQPLAAVEKLGKTVAFDQFHRDVGAVLDGSISYLESLDDVRVPEAGDQTSFLAKTVSQRVVGIGRQELQRDKSFLDLIVRPVDAGGAAAAKTVTQQEAADPLVGRRGGFPVSRGIWGHLA